MYLGSHAHGPEVSAADLDRVTDSHYDFLGSFLGRYATCVVPCTFNGFLFFRVNEFL